MSCRKGQESPFGIETGWYTTVALVEEEEEASPPGSPSKQAATSSELAKSPRPAPARQWSGRGSGQDAGCSCGCADVDVRARRLWERATHDEPSSGPPFPQSETRTALPTRQTTVGSPAQRRADRAWDRGSRRVPPSHTRR